MTMLKSFEFEDSDDVVTGNQALRCPGCGGFYLHHHDVAVFYREREDQPSTSVTVHEKTATFAAYDERNPSIRRDGITIAMDCENCKAVLEFAIVQHKGMTYLGWHVVVTDEEQIAAKVAKKLEE